MCLKKDNFQTSVSFGKDIKTVFYDMLLDLV